MSGENVIPQHKSRHEIYIGSLYFSGVFEEIILHGRKYRIVVRRKRFCDCADTFRFYVISSRFSFSETFSDYFGKKLLVFFHGKNLKQLYLFRKFFPFFGYLQRTACSNQAAISTETLRPVDKRILRQSSGFGKVPEYIGKYFFDEEVGSLRECCEFFEISPPSANPTKSCNRNNCNLDYERDYLSDCFKTHNLAVKTFLIPVYHMSNTAYQRQNARLLTLP